MAGGRQREFDKTDVLDKAMRVFWKKGYSGASLTDLTSGMGINKPSLYSAFGNKEQLFIQATAHYLSHYAQPHAKHLTGNATVKEQLSRYLHSIITAQCAPNNPKGCYVSVCVSEAETEDLPPAAAALVEEVNHFSERGLVTFFTHSMKQGDLPSHINITTLARYFTAFLHGTAALARGGRNANELTDLINPTLRVLD